jgi:antitoxin component of MazEF toxin-antitoxin module
MKITSEQKVIKVGSSLALTIPAKEAAKAGIVAGSIVKSEIEPISTPNKEILDEYEAFKSKYSQTLKNLSNR